jgi:hypothetical protein
MIATATLKAMNGLSETQRRRALQLQAQIETMSAELEALLLMAGGGSDAVELHDRNIGEHQAADLRARLKTFADDWNRPEADIYDQTPAR